MIVIRLQRATKRTSPDPSDSDVDVEDKPTPKDRKAMPSAMSNARLKKGIVMSDDEDEEVPNKSHKKITRSTSDSERSLAAMMDIDDGPLSQTIPNVMLINQQIKLSGRPACPLVAPMM